MYKLLNNHQGSVMNTDLINGKFYDVEIDGTFRDEANDLRDEAYHNFVDAEEFTAVLVSEKAPLVDTTIGKRYTIFKDSDIGRYAFRDDAGDLRSPCNCLRRWTDVKIVKQEQEETTMGSNNEPLYVLILDNEGFPYLTNGKIYEVDEVDWADDPQITDDDGDSFDTDALSGDSMIVIKEDTEVQVVLQSLRCTYSDWTSGKVYTLGTKRDLLGRVRAAFVDDVGDHCDAQRGIWSKYEEPSEDVEEEQDQPQKKGYLFRTNNRDHAERVQRMLVSLGYEFPAAEAPAFLDHGCYVAIPGGTGNLLLLHHDLAPSDQYEEVNVEWMDKGTPVEEVEIDGESYALHEVKAALEDSNVSPVE